jgi:cytochrome bd-type quinol oxidase subunit 2
LITVLKQPITEQQPAPPAGLTAGEPGTLTGAAVVVTRHGPDDEVRRWAVGLAAAAAVVIAASFAIFGVAYAIGGSGATEDTWVGFLVMVSLLGASLASLAAFALAVVAKVKHERWALLWLPLSVLPALLAFVVLGEALWWE